MISLKDYINESVFDDEKVIMDNTLKANLAAVRNWVKINNNRTRRTSRGSTKVYIDKSDTSYVVEYVKVETTCIDFSTLPFPGIKFKFVQPKDLLLEIKNAPDRFMDYISCEGDMHTLKFSIDPSEGDIDDIGEVNVGKIHGIYYTETKNNRSIDLSPFAKHNLYKILIQTNDGDPNIKSNINLNGIHIDELNIFSGTINLKGNYSVDQIIAIDGNSRNTGLPKKTNHIKVSFYMHGPQVVSSWANDVMNNKLKLPKFNTIRLAGGNTNRDCDEKSFEQALIELSKY